MGRPALSPVEEDRARDEIISVARNLFIHNGFDAVTVRKIAEGVGCSPMRLYRFYPNKRAILRRLWDDIFIELFADLLPKVDAEPTPQGQLRRFVSEYVGYWLRNPGEYRVIFMNQDAVSDEDDTFYVDDSDTLTRSGALTEILEAGVAAGAFGPMNTELATQQLLCLTHGIAHMLITVPEYPWAPGEQIVSGCVDMVLHGFLAQHERC